MSEIRGQARSHEPGPGDGADAGKRPYAWGVLRVVMIVLAARACPIDQAVAASGQAGGVVAGSAAGGGRKRARMSSGTPRR